MEKVLAAGTARMTTGSRQGVIDGLEQAFLAEMLKYAGLDHVDKWRSQSLMQAMSMKPRKLSAVLS